MSDNKEPWIWGDEGQPKPEPQPRVLGQRHLCCGYDAEMRPFGQGDWVAYEDYKKVEDSLRHYIEQEALRKIGEDMEQPNSDKLEFIHRMDSLAIKKQKEVIENLQAQVDFYKKKLENETDYLVKIGLIDQVTHLKAEVERLRKAEEMMDRERMSDEYDLNNQTRIINGLLRDKEQLKAENERLRKAGDMCDQLLACFEMEGRKGVNIGRDMWNAAKEGKNT